MLGRTPTRAAAPATEPVATNAARTSTWRAVGVRGREPHRLDERGDGVAGGGRPRHRHGETGLGGVVDDRADPPGPAAARLVLGEVGLPDPVAPRGRGHEEGPPGHRERSPLGLVAHGEQEIPPREGPQHGAPAHAHPVGAEHGPDLAVAPCCFAAREVRERQDAELFIHSAEIAGVFVGFGALIAIRSGATMTTSEVNAIRWVMTAGIWGRPSARGPGACARCWFLRSPARGAPGSAPPATPPPALGRSAARW